MRNRLYSALKLLISIGLLLLLFRLVDPGEAWAALRRMDLRFFLAGLALFIFSMVLRAARWQFLLRAVDVHPPFSRLAYLYLVGAFFNTFLPSGFGGDAIKAYELARYTHRGAEALSTVLVDRLSGLIVQFAVGLLALPLAARAAVALPQRELLVLAGASAVGLVGSWLLFQRRAAEPVLRLAPARLRGKLEEFYTAVHRCGGRALWQAMAVSLLFMGILSLMNYLIALALNASVPFIYFLVFMPILSLSMLLPSFGALGTREAAYVLLFSAVGVPQPTAVAMSLTYYMINLLTGGLGGALYAVGALGGLKRTDEPLVR